MNNPFDWESFEHRLREQLPNLNNGHSKRRENDFNWVQKFVDEVFEHSFKPPPNINLFKPNPAAHPQTKPAQTKHTTEHEHHQLFHLKPKIKQTAKEIIVRMDVPEGLNINRIRVECNAYRLKIKVLPQQHPQLLTLPTKVLARQARAIYRHTTIDIRLPKHPDKETFQSIPIHYER